MRDADNTNTLDKGPGNMCMFWNEKACGCTDQPQNSRIAGGQQ